MDNNMLKIDVSSKAVETFIDAISRGIGVLYEHLHVYEKKQRQKQKKRSFLLKQKSRSGKYWQPFNLWLEILFLLSNCSR